MCQNLSNPGHVTLLDIAHCAPIIILCIHQHVEPAIVAECCRKKNDKREHVSFACVGGGVWGTCTAGMKRKKKSYLLVCLFWDWNIHNFVFVDWVFCVRIIYFPQRFYCIGDLVTTFSQLPVFQIPHRVQHFKPFIVQIKHNQKVMPGMFIRLY